MEESEEKSKKKLSESDFIERLRARYQAPEWAFFDHVPSATGGAANRTADGIAFNCWPSRGLSIIGFEIKSRRADFLNELKDPSKSAEIQRFCDYWYLVAEKDVVRPGELPDAWGLILPHGKGLTIVKEAPILSSNQVDRNFLAALARTIHKEIKLPEEIKAKVDKAYNDGMAYGAERHRWKVEKLENDVRSLESAIQTFEQKSGININSWHIDKVSDMVRMLKDDAHELDVLKDVDVAVSNAEKDLSILIKARDQMKMIRNMSGVGTDGEVS